MSFRNPFSIRKTKPRHATSRSPIKLPADEMTRELGPNYQTIDSLVGNQRITYNIEQARWISGGVVSTSIDSREMAKLEKTKLDLEEENNILRVKLEMLLEMLAEITAEQQLRQSG